MKREIKRQKADRKTRQQLSFGAPGVRPEKSEHGGVCKNPQKRRRPLGTKSSMHLTLRSSKAVKDWSFRKHEKAIDDILRSFAKKYHVEIFSMANVGNHIHMHLRFFDRATYRAFIRAITAAIMIKITKLSRWNKPKKGFQFWDQRPYSRLITSWTDYLNVHKYIRINQWEGQRNLTRERARLWVKQGFYVPTPLSGFD